MMAFILAILAAGVIVYAFCRAASKPLPDMPTDAEVKEMENHLMRKALLRGSK